jgi:chromosome segregation ATPase
MSAPPKKPPGGSPGARRPPGDTAGQARVTTPSSTTANGLGRTRSLRGSPLPARAGQRPGAGASNLSTSSAASNAEDDARAEAVAVLDDLKERLRKSETASDQFQKQAQVLQSRLDEALAEQGKLEDRLHESDEKLEALENGQREAQKQRGVQ